MKAMVINRIMRIDENSQPLEWIELPDPKPDQHEILIKVTACGVCHTELDEIEGRAQPPRLPVVPGHEIVGRIVQVGSNVRRLKIGDRVGVGWIHSACGECHFCMAGNENLCTYFKATGKDANGGYAEYMTVSEDFAYKIPGLFSDTEATPLLCAGAIGYRSLRLTGIQNGQNLGLTGFGASAHLVLKMARFLYPLSLVFIFARSEKERTFAEELGAFWTGDTNESPPEKLHSIIDTTPVWKPIVEALKNLERGGRLVINAIRKEDIDKDYLLNMHYSSHLWLEKEIKSVANVTRKDISECIRLAAEMHLRSEIQEYLLEDANQALIELKAGKIRGAKVLRIN